MLMKQNAPSPLQQDVLITLDDVELEGQFTLPENAQGLVIFAHGSGSSRHSPRNQFVAEKLVDDQIATLLFDLLTESEDQSRFERFDIAKLAERLVKATRWAQTQKTVTNLPLGYFGASTGAAAALIAAAILNDDIVCVVSRGGRPDLADEALEAVQAPTLLIVGEKDETVLELNEQAFKRLSCEKKLVVIPGATHLFEEDGALEDAAEAASHWFQAHL